MSGDLPIDVHPLTMSSLEIAGLTGKQHKNVLRDARKMLEALAIQPAQFSARYQDAKGEEREVINLPKRECLILVSGYSVEMRARIIDRWIELEIALRDKVAAPEPGATPYTVSDAIRIFNAAATARCWEGAALRQLWLSLCPPLPKVAAMLEGARQFDLFPDQWSRQPPTGAKQ